MSKCETCNGTGQYLEYDDFDRYIVHVCSYCDGTGEAKTKPSRYESFREQTATIDGLASWEYENNGECCVHCVNWGNCSLYGIEDAESHCKAGIKAYLEGLSE